MEERLRALAEQLERALNNRDVEGTIAAVRQLDQEQVDVMLSFTPRPEEQHQPAQEEQWHQSYRSS